MLIETGWSYYFRVLKYFGILPISLSKEGHVVSTKLDRKVHRCMLTVIQAVITGLFIYGKLKYWSSTFVNYGSTGQSVGFFEVLSTGVINIVIHAWMFFSLEENLELVRDLLECDRKTFHLAVNERNRTLRTFFKVTSCIVFFAINGLAVSFSYHNLQLNSTIINMEYIVNFAHSGFIVSFYTSLVKKVENILVRVNLGFDEASRHLKFLREKEDTLSLNEEIAKLFRIRYRVLAMCSCHISKVYGFVNLLASPFMLLDFTHGLYYLVYRLEQQDFSTWINIIFSVQTSILYIIPKLVVFLSTFTCNNIGKEVSFWGSLYYHFVCLSLKFLGVRSQVPNNDYG